MNRVRVKRPKSRTITLKPNSLLVYKRPKDMTEEAFSTFLDKAANDVLARFGISTIVVGVNNWNEVMLADETTMQKYGWVRAERVFLYKDQVDLTQYEPEDLEAIMEAYIPSLSRPKDTEEE